MGSHSSRGNREHRRHLHGTPGLAGDLGLRFSGDGPRPGLSESHSPDRDRDESSPAVQCGSECPGDLRARRKLRENGDDSRPFFLRSYSRDVFSFVPFSVDVDVGVSAGSGSTLSKLGHGDSEFCLNMPSDKSLSGTLACFSSFFSFRRRTRALKLNGDVDRVTFPGIGSGTVSDEKLPPAGVAVPGDDPNEQVDPPDPDLSSLNRFAGTGSGDVDPVDPADDQGDRLSIVFFLLSSSDIIIFIQIVDLLISSHIQIRNRICNFVNLPNSSQ